VKVPRFRIAWVMVFVAFAALNFAAMRVVLVQSGPTSELLAVGALPMAIILAVGHLVGLRRRGSRPFLLGFEVFGVMALAIYVALVSFSPQKTVIPYLDALLQPIRQTIGQARPIVLVVTIVPVAVAMLGLPQLTFALLGGFLSRNNRISLTITKRPAQFPADR
jgi:hypothetical protein